MDNPGPIVVDHLPGTSGVDVTILEGLEQVLGDLLLRLIPGEGGQGRLVLQQAAHGVEGATELPVYRVPDPGVCPTLSKGAQRGLILVQSRLVVRQLGKLLPPLRSAKALGVAGNPP